MENEGYLFSDYDLRAVLESQGRKLADEIAGIPAERVLATTPESWGDYFEEKYRINVPRLKRDEVAVDQQEDQVDVSRDPGRLIRDRSRPFYLAGTRFLFFVPFEGDAEVFKCRPSTWTSVLVLRYASWRDTKTAILLFNRGRSLSAVLAKIPEIVQVHANFVRKVETDGETRFRFVLHHRDDKERELSLTVLVFEVPA